MYEKMLAQSEENLKTYQKEKFFLIGYIGYLPAVLSAIDGDEDILSQACNEIVNYLSEVLECVSLEWEIMNAINRYLWSLTSDFPAFNGFETSPEFLLFKGIFELLENTYPQRVSEYMWYIRQYKNYADTNCIAKSYKIISKRKHLSKERYASLLNTIPKV